MRAVRALGAGPTGQRARWNLKGGLLGAGLQQVPEGPGVTPCGRGGPVWAGPRALALWAGPPEQAPRSFERSRLVTKD